MRLGFLLLLLGCTPPSAPIDVPLPSLAVRCAEDCRYYEAIFENVTYEVAVTGEDSWRCVCLKGPEEIRIW